ncbi:hypothetical protein DNTS_016960, partial [Danionella cerebrum]
FLSFFLSCVQTVAHFLLILRLTGLNQQHNLLLRSNSRNGYASFIVPDEPATRLVRKAGLHAGAMFKNFSKHMWRLHHVWTRLCMNFTKMGEQEAARCDTVALLLERGCVKDSIINPKNKFEYVKDDPLVAGANPVQIQPQEIRLNLRPGMPQTFQLRFKRAEGYPVDLYYLMDLSYSMKDDLKNVKKLGIDLLKELNKITGNAKIAKLKHPCPDKKEQCQPAFGFQHVLPLTADERKFEDMVSKQHISGNLDPPEGSLDAIMQAAVCVNDIGWGNSTRLLVVATDDGFHMAGDGKLAAILEPNKETCQLVNNMYSKSNIWDYPSVGQIARKLEEQNIQPIFAVTKKMENIYTELSKLIPKSAVGVLSEDSSNVVNLIVDAYNSLTSEVIMAHDFLPNFVSVKYTSNCRGGETLSDRGKCDNVAIGDEVIFQVTVKAERCISSQNFLIGPLGFNEKLKVNIETRCECNCKDPDGLHHHCGGHGRIVCGGCICNSDYLGRRCECKLGQMDEASLKAQCRKDNGTECEGKGDCVCGRCQCHKTEIGGNFYGEHCECDDEHCEKFDNKQCAGHGKCKCGKCECEEGYEGTACHCAKSDTDCKKAEGNVCFNRGKCVCNQCECQRGYKGPFCEKCPACQRPCQESGSCVECLAFGSGPFEKNCSLACKHLQHEMVEKLAKIDCRIKDQKGCWMSFKMTELLGFDTYFVSILKDIECPEGPNIPAIVGGSLAGVALIGLLILLIVKALLYARDIREWKRFEKCRKHEKTSGTNPLFQNATTTVQNPTFSGDS